MLSRIRLHFNQLTCHSHKNHRSLYQFYTVHFQFIEMENSKTQFRTFFSHPIEEKYFYLFKKYLQFQKYFVKKHNKKKNCPGISQIKIRLRMIALFFLKCDPFHSKFMKTMMRLNLNKNQRKRVLTWINFYFMDKIRNDIKNKYCCVVNWADRRAYLKLFFIFLVYLCKFRYFFLIKYKYWLSML